MHTKKKKQNISGDGVGNVDSNSHTRKITKTTHKKKHDGGNKPTFDHAAHPFHQENATAAKKRHSDHVQAALARTNEQFEEGQGWIASLPPRALFCLFFHCRHVKRR